MVLQLGAPIRAIASAAADVPEDHAVAVEPNQIKYLEEDWFDNVIKSHRFNDTLHYFGKIFVNHQCRVYHCASNGLRENELEHFLFKWDQFNLNVRNSHSNCRKYIRKLEKIRGIWHENIIKFRESRGHIFSDIIHGNGERIPGFLVKFDFCSSINLSRVSSVRHYDAFEQIEPLFLQISSAIEYLHTNDIVHDHICSDNIFIANCYNLTSEFIQENAHTFHYKLGDFKWSFRYCSDSYKSILTRDDEKYISNDKWSNIPQISDWCAYDGFLSDNFAFGVTLLTAIKTPVIIGKIKYPRLLSFYSFEAYEKNGYLDFLKNHPRFMKALESLCAMNSWEQQFITQIIQKYKQLN